MADEQTNTPPVPLATVEHPDISAGALRLSDSGNVPTGKPLSAKDGKGKARVRTAYPVDAFDASLKDVPQITRAGVEVNRSDVERLLKSAAAAGVTLEEI